MLQLENVVKHYEGQLLLAGITFNVSTSETVCLLGASGSGKSTLLRMIAGLEPVEGGTICWDGKDLSRIPAHLRRFGMVFQDYALFPHLTVAGNVAFGLKMQGCSKVETDARVAEMLKLVDLSSFASRRVTDLSGGEQQRVALARALAPAPRLLMFDEPLGALDRTLRDHMLGELRKILRRTGIPAIYVTHDQEEASAIADRLLLLHDGCIVREGTPLQVRQDPGLPWVATFLGLGSILKGKSHGDEWVETPFGKLKHACRHPHQKGDQVTLLIRPGSASTRRCENEIKSCVVEVIFQDDEFRVNLENGLFFDFKTAPPVGELIAVHVPASAVECLGKSPPGHSDEYEKKV